jgi:hypothetical protein
MTSRTIRIGGASGFWGDASIATPQLLAGGDLDYIVYDYLAEVTMSIMARAQIKDDQKGYAVDFVSSAMGPNLHEIAHQGVKVVANAGGLNPLACAKALRQLIRSEGLNLKVGVVLGDNQIGRKMEIAEMGTVEMFSGDDFPPLDTVTSINAYLGAFPIAKALDSGADIVITGRCVDSAVTLGACIHEFGWQRDDYDKLAGGSLAGHVIECGTQACGGNFTDWELVAETLVDAGYPIAEINCDGGFVCTKPNGSGGVISVGSIAEQLLYEIGDPSAYVLPDVICDFTNVRVDEEARNRVRVSHARGRTAPDAYKVSATWADGFRGGEIWTVYGRDAERKARIIAENALFRARRVLKAQRLPDFTEVCIEIIGAESHYGASRQVGNVREVDLKLGVKHPNVAGIGILFKEFIGLGLASPPGMTGFGGRPRHAPVVRLFSFLLQKQEVTISVDVDGHVQTCNDVIPIEAAALRAAKRSGPDAADFSGETVAVPLEKVAWGRSGDKGNNANIGIIARKPEYMPYIMDTLTEELVAGRFSHFLEGDVERFYMPGLPAVNFLLHDVLGGGGMASLRNDPQGKGFAQLLLDECIEIPRHLAESAK